VNSALVAPYAASNDVVYEAKLVGADYFVGFSSNAIYLRLSARYDNLRSIIENTVNFFIWQLYCLARAACMPRWHVLLMFFSLFVLYLSMVIFSSRNLRICCTDFDQVFNKDRYLVVDYSLDLLFPISQRKLPWQQF